MALSDLEMLQLAERAAEGRKGERGPEGTGIRSVTSPDSETIVITLTDGRKFEHVVPKPAMGEPGPAGQTGARGESGTPGPRGPSGQAGRDGRDGQDGSPGTFVDSALVDPSGQLLVGLSSGEIIRAGTVVGPAGETGARGATGLSGSRGADGSAFLSGEKPPSDSEDGNDGDFWLDLSSPQYDLYGPKRGGAWGPRRTFLKQPPAQENVPLRSLPVGGGGGGSGGAPAAPALRVPLGAGIETQIGTVPGEATVLDYKVTATADNTQWSAANMNAAANGITAAGDAFTIGAELTGVGGDLDLVWRIARNPGLDQLTVFATSPVDALLEGRFSPYTDS